MRIELAQQDELFSRANAMDELSGSIGEKIVQVAQLAVAMHLASTERSQDILLISRKHPVEEQAAIGGTDSRVTDDSRAFERN